MKVNLVMDSISRAGGGLLEAERNLHQALTKHGVETSVFALEDKYSHEDSKGWAPLIPQVFPLRQPQFLGRSPEMGRRLAITPADLIYRVGLWRLPSFYAHTWSKTHHRPEIIAPHGMLDPWAVRNSRWKKRIVRGLFEARHLRDAACIRALCASEAEAIRAYGSKNSICVVPNGVDLPVGMDQVWEDRGQVRGSAKILLFLGRLHPKKGLSNALRAWAQVRGQNRIVRCQEEWQFMLAGWDQGGHEADLKGLCDELGLAYSETPVSEFLTEIPDHRNTEFPASVLFVGPAFGHEKDALLRQASAFILPSFSEGLPMSVLEAWSYGLPVLMTDHCNLPEGFTADAAIRIGTDVESIANGMADLLQSSVSDLRSLGSNGRALVERQFTWDQVAAQMKEVYEWLVGGGETPTSVER